MIIIGDDDALKKGLSAHNMRYLVGCFPSNKSRYCFYEDVTIIPRKKLLSTFIEMQDVYQA